MGGDAVFGHLVHLGRADLHFNRPVAANHGRVQGLVTVGFGQADVVLEAPRNRPEGVMYHGQGAITAFDIGREDPQGRHVVDLVERLLLALHLAPDAIKMFGSAAHLAIGQARRHQAVAQQLHRDAEALLPVAALGGNLLLDLAEGLRFKNFEGQVFQFPLQAADAEAVGQGAVDLAGFAGNALLFFRLEGADRAHVVQPVGQLHQHHPDVAGHGQKHAAQVFRLGFGAVGEMDAAELGHPLHQGPHLSAKVLLNLGGGDVGVLDHVVEKPGGNHAGAGADIAQQVGHRHRVNDVGLATGAHLAVVELEGEVKGGRQQGVAVGRTGGARGGEALVDAAAQPGRQWDAVGVGRADRLGPAGQRAVGLGRVAAVLAPLDLGPGRPWGWGWGGSG